MDTRPNQKKPPKPPDFSTTNFDPIDNPYTPTSSGSTRPIPSHAISEPFTPKNPNSPNLAPTSKTNKTTEPTKIDSAPTTNNAQTTAKPDPTKSTLFQILSIILTVISVILALGFSFPLLMPFLFLLSLTALPTIFTIFFLMIPPIAAMIFATMSDKGKSFESPIYTINITAMGLIILFSIF